MAAVLPMREYTGTEPLKKITNTIGFLFNIYDSPIGIFYIGSFGFYIEFRNRLFAKLSFEYGCFHSLDCSCIHFCVIFRNEIFLF